MSRRKWVECCPASPAASCTAIVGSLVRKGSFITFLTPNGSPRRRSAACQDGDISDAATACLAAAGSTASRALAPQGHGTPTGSVRSARRGRPAPRGAIDRTSPPARRVPRERGIGGRLAADADRLAAACPAAAAVAATRSSSAGCQGSSSSARRAELAVGGEGVLAQVVGADADGSRGARAAWPARSAAAGISTMAPAAPGRGRAPGGERPRPRRGGHHRRHHPALPRRCRPRPKRRQLVVQDLGVAGASAGPGRRGPGSPRRRREEGQRLVGAGVQRADDHTTAGEGREDLAGRRRSARPGRRVGAVEEQELGAEQADALGAGGAVRPRRRRCWQQGDRVAVGGPARAVDRRALRPRRGLAARAARRGSGRPRPCRAEPSTATAVPRRARSAPATADHGRQAERLGQDRGVAGRPATPVTRATTRVRVRAGRCRRGRGRGDQHVRVAGVGQPGHRAGRAGGAIVRSRRSSRSAARSAR